MTAAIIRDPNGANSMREAAAAGCKLTSLASSTCVSSSMVDQSGPLHEGAGAAVSISGVGSMEIELGSTSKMLSWPDDSSTRLWVESAMRGRSRRVATISRGK